jgi:VanZ family protein
LNPATEIPPPERIRSHRRLFWLALALVVYGSLFPFHYQVHVPSWGDGWALLRPQARHSRSDLLGNVLLFVPYGLLLALPMSLSRRLLALLGGAALALGLQYLQFWFPDRVPSGTDAVLNWVGIAIGLGAGLLVLPWVQRRQSVDWPRPQFVLVASLLMALWLLYRWFPLVPTLDVQNLKNGLKPLLQWRDMGALDMLRNLAGWLVFLRLARYSGLQRWGNWQLATLCLAVMAAEPLFVNNAISPANAVGLALALALFPLLRSGPSKLLVITGVLAVSIVVAALSPFEWRWVGGFLWFPFAGSLGGDPIRAMEPLIEKLYLLGSLVFFVRHLGASHGLTVLTLGTLVLALELAQQALPGRTPEVTDPLLVLGMAWLMRPLFEQVRLCPQHKPMPLL